MADQKRWFKVWTSILNDPTFLGLPDEVLGRWTRLGAWIASHGDKGRLTAPESAFRHVLRIPVNLSLKDNVCMLPHVVFEEGKTDNGTFTVIMEKWSKYQEDSTAYERLKRHRSKHNDNGVRGEEKRGEETRREEKEPYPIVPSPLATAESTVLQAIGTLTGRTWKPGMSYGENLRARLEEGYTVEDCLRVVEYKAEAWLGKPDMAGYLTPVTLFRPKNFERYLVEIQSPSNGNGKTPQVELPKRTQQNLHAVAQFLNRRRPAVSHLEHPK